MQHVTTRVADASAALGKPQQPTLRGQIDGAFEWPVLKPRALFAEHFPERISQPITSEVSSLASLGFPEGLVDAWSSSIGSLNALQIEAINDYGALDGKHLVVVAPTSSGKTMIGELAAAKAAMERRRAFFLLPLRALVSDKYREFVQRYGVYGLTVIRATGEIVNDNPALMRGQYDLCLMTYEKFTALAVSNPHILSQVVVVVIDELQMIADQGRGANLEFLMTLLRVRRHEGVDPQVIALSGVIGASNGIERWLDAGLLRSDQRPVPLSEGILGRDGSYRYITAEGEEERVPEFIRPQSARSANRGLLAPLVGRLISEGKQVLVFRETRSGARSVASYLARELNLKPAHEALLALPAGDPSRTSEQPRAALGGGVAFHISYLDRVERQVVEEHFRKPDSAIRIIVATTTLAMGVNTPADAVVIVGLEHPGPDGGPYAVAEYKNMVGRAGRLGYTTEGCSYLLATSGHAEDRLWQSYVRSTPEGIESRFLTTHRDPRSLIVRVLAASPSSAGAGLAAPDVVSFIEESFEALRAAQQRQAWTRRGRRDPGRCDAYRRHPPRRNARCRASSSRH
jgi:replicative superfamily II helicase